MMFNSQILGILLFLILPVKNIQARMRQFNETDKTLDNVPVYPIEYDDFDKFWVVYKKSNGQSKIRFGVFLVLSDSTDIEMAGEQFELDEKISNKFIPDVTTNRECVIQNNRKFVQLLCISNSTNMRISHTSPNPNFQYQFGHNDIFFLNKTHAIDLKKMRNSPKGSEQKSIMEVKDIPSEVIDDRIIETIQDDCFNDNVYCQHDIKRTSLHRDDSETVFHSYRLKIILAEVVGRKNETLLTQSNITYIIQDEESGAFYIPKDLQLRKGGVSIDKIENRYLIIPIISESNHFVAVRRLKIKCGGFKQHDAKLILTFGVLFLLLVKRIY